MLLALEKAGIELIHQGIALRALDGAHLIRSIERLAPPLLSFVMDF